MKNNNILMFSIFGIAIIYMCMSGIKVYASEETNSITDGSYTVTIPSEVQIPSGSNSNSFDVTCDKIYIDDSVTVKVDKKSGNLTNMNGSATIPYAISINNDQSSNVMIFTSNKTTNKINVQLSGTGNIAGTYTDTLTFNISSVKQKYSLNIRGYLEGNSMSNIGEIADITVTGINDSASNSLQYSNVNSTTKYIINVSIKDSSKYVLSEVKNNVKSDASTGFEWNEVNNTITGTVAGDYASDDGTVYLDLYFVPKKYKLTFDVNDGQFSNESNETTQKTYQVKYGEPLTQIDSEDLKLNKRDPFYFGGWYKTKTKDGEFGIPEKSSSTMPNRDLTLYAGWSQGVNVGLNAVLEGESVLRRDLNGLGTADFIIKNDEIKSRRGVTDIYEMYHSTDEYKLEVHANYGYKYVGLSGEEYDQSNTKIIGTTNEFGRLYDQPLGSADGTRLVSFNVMFAPITCTITYTTTVEGLKDGFQLNNDTYKFNQGLTSNLVTLL